MLEGLKLYESNFLCCEQLLNPSQVEYAFLEILVSSSFERILLEIETYQAKPVKFGKNFLKSSDIFIVPTIYRRIRKKAL